MPLPSFIFNAEKETPETLARRRALAEAMLNRGQTGVASNVGEGLAQLGQALGGRIKLGSVNRAETANRSRALGALGPLLGMTPQSPVADTPLTGSAGSETLAGGTDIAGGIRSTADALGIDPIDLATAISYETAGTFNPTKGGPTTKWGKHRGLIQFGEPQAKQFGVDWKDPVGSQLGPEGAVAKYLRSTGVKPGMGMMDIYSAINAGGVGRYGASDAKNGGAPGTVADKVNTQMAGHRAKAIALLKTAQAAAPQAGSAPGAGVAMTGFPPVQAPQSPQIATAPSMTPAAPQIVPTAGPAPQSPQMAPQAPLTAYQRMMATSLGKEAGGLQAPPNRAQMAAVMGQGGNGSGGGILNSIFGGGSAPAPAPAVSPFAAPQAPASAPTPAPAGDKLGQLQSFIAGPDFAWLEHPQQKFVMDEYERERAAANPDPMAKVQLETAQVNLDKLKNPKPEQPRTTTIDGVLLVEQPDKSWKPAYTAPQKTEKPPAGVQEYEYYRQQAIAAGQTPVDFMTWKKSNTPSTNVTVTNGVEPPDNKLREGIDKAEGDQLVKYKDAAAVSGQNAQDFATLEELIKIAPQGPITGRLAEAFPGFSSSGDAFRSIVVRIAPTLRAPGSGSTSDIEYDGMLKSLPALRNNPQANVAILQIMKDKATLNVKRGEVITRYQTGEIPASQMRKELNELNKISIISPEMKKQLSGLGAQSSEAPPAAVQPSQPESGSGDFLPETLSIIRQKQGFTSDQQALDYLTKKKAEGWTIAPNGVMYQEVK